MNFNADTDQELWNNKRYSKMNKREIVCSLMPGPLSASLPDDRRPVCAAWRGPAESEA
jgi:hypothetical protein